MHSRFISPSPVRDVVLRVAALVAFGLVTGQAAESWTAGPASSTGSLAAPPPAVTALPGPDAVSIPWHRQAEAAAKAAQAARFQAAKPTDGAAALPLDATYYHLELVFDTTARSVRGALAMEARIGGAPLAAVHLDFDTVMHVDSLRVDGVLAVFAHSADDLVIQLGRTYASGEALRIEVFYAGTPNSSSALHFDTRNSQPVVWTLSEPFGSRTWWPCQDTPADKADSVDVVLDVPSTLIAISNGTLTGTTTGSGRTRYHWHESYPITPYLVSVAAHPYVQLSATYTPLAGGSMPVSLYSYTDQVGLAQPVLGLTVQVLNRFAQLFGEYPFVTEKYAWRSSRGAAGWSTRRPPACAAGAPC